MDAERLSATDEAFLAMEHRGLTMNVGVLLVVQGKVELEGARGRVREALGRVPRLQQKVTRVRGLGQAWTEDPRFELASHVVAMTVPRPGRHDELMEVAGRLFSSPLDRTRPLWKLWVISGLEGGRSAIVLIAHHAMVDGVGGIGMLAAILAGRGGAASPTAVSAPRAPTRRALARVLIVDRTRALVKAVRALRPSSSVVAARKAGTVAVGLVGAVRDGLTPAPRTALNPKRVSRSRGFEGVRLDLARAKAIRVALGGTINDVVLATVTGAVRRYLGRRGDVDRVRRFRALVPVDLRARTGEPHPMGNSVAFMLASLPVAEPNARARYDAVRARTEHLKRSSHEIEATAFIEQLADVALPRFVELVFRVAARVRAFHVVVTNVPGPPTAFCFGSSRIDEAYGLVPLFAQQALGIAVLSYAGSLFVGLHTDAGVVADPRELAGDVEAAFEELAALAELAAPKTQAPLESRRNGMRA